MDICLIKLIATLFMVGGAVIIAVTVFSFMKTVEEKLKSKYKYLTRFLFYVKYFFLVLVLLSLLMISIRDVQVIDCFNNI